MWCCPWRAVSAARRRLLAGAAVSYTANFTSFTAAMAATAAAADAAALPYLAGRGPLCAPPVTHYDEDMLACLRASSVPTSLNANQHTSMSPRFDRLS